MRPRRDAPITSNCKYVWRSTLCLLCTHIKPCHVASAAQQHFARRRQAHMMRQIRVRSRRRQKKPATSSTSSHHHQHGCEQRQSGKIGQTTDRSNRVWFFYCASARGVSVCKMHRATMCGPRRERHEKRVWIVNGMYTNISKREEQRVSIEVSLSEES